jgi:hypothetical protein
MIRGGRGGEDEEEVAWAAGVRAERRRRGRGVRRVLGELGARRRGALPAVPGGGLPLHPPAADLPGARAAGHRVPAVALAAARLHPAGVRRRPGAGGSARQADAVRGRLPGPRAVRVHGVPAPVRHPGRRSQVVPDVAGPAAHGVRRRGLQRDGGVLLGAVPARVQLGQRRRAPDLRAHGAARLHRLPRPALEGCRRDRLQHLPLVVHRPALQDLVHACFIELLGVHVSNGQWTN